MNRKDLLVILFLTLLVVAFFHEAAFLQKTFFYQDISIQNYPCRYFFAEQWKQGRWPLWCPDMLGGFPLFAEGQSGAAYPLNLLLYPFLKTWVALNISVLLHYALAALGMYLLLRLWAGRWGAALGAMTYTLNGWMISHLIHINALNAAAWTPLVFYFMERTFRKGQAWTLLLGATALAMQFLAGHPQTALMTCMGALLFVAFRIGIEWKKGKAEVAIRAGLAGSVLLVLAVGLAAIQILPTQELLEHSSRSEAQSHEFLTFGSFPPSFAALFLMPSFYGSSANDTYWMKGLDIPFHEMNFYMGLLPLFLAVFALFRRRDTPTFFFALLLAFSGLFMLGKYSPFYPLHELLPVLNRMRVPARYAYLLVFALAGLAGLGFDGLIQKDVAWPSRRRLLIGFVMALILPALLAGWTYWSMQEDGVGLVTRLKSELLIDGIRNSCFFILSSVLLLFLPGMRGHKKRMGLVVALLVTALDLWSANHNLNPTIDPAYYEEAPKTAQWLKRVRDAEDASSNLHHFRIYDFDRSSHPTPSGWNVRWPYFKEREPLNVCFPMSYGLSSLDGHAGLYPDRWWAFDHDITANRLGAMAVRYVVGKPPRDKEWFKKVTNDTPLPIYENLKAAPRAFLVSKALKFSEPVSFFQALSSPDFNPKKTVLLENPEAPSIKEWDSSNGNVQFIMDEPDRVTLEVQTNTSTYLVLADTWFPGWEATVDGHPTQIYRANFYARAVFISKGQHRVEFRYQPSSFRRGVMLTFVAMMVGIVASLAFRKRAPFRLSKEKTLMTVSEWNHAFRILAVVAAFVILLSAIMEFENWANAFQQFGLFVR